MIPYFEGIEAIICPVHTGVNKRYKSMLKSTIYLNKVLKTKINQANLKNFGLRLPYNNTGFVQTVPVHFEKLLG